MRILLRILSWTLKTVIYSRAGDVSLTKGHKGVLNTLLWSDVRIRIESGNIGNLLVALRLRNSKNIRSVRFRTTGTFHARFSLAVDPILLSILSVVEALLLSISFLTASSSVVCMFSHRVHWLLVIVPYQGPHLL